MGQFAHNGRKVTVDVVQVNDVGLEIVEHSLETAAHIAHAQRALESTQLVTCPTAKGHLAGKLVGITGRQIIGVLHGKDLSVHAVLTEQGLGIEDDDAIAAPRIIEFIDQEYSLSHESTTRN